MDNLKKLIWICLCTGVHTSFAQTKAKALDSTINALQEAYQQVLFYDDFREDTNMNFPMHWIVDNKYKGYVKDKTIARVKTIRDTRLADIAFCGPWWHIYPAINNKPVVLPDSFLVEYDFIVEKYFRSVDTTYTKVCVPKDPDKLWWPGTDYSKAGVYNEPHKDTFRIYPTAVFSGSFNYSAWHHCMIWVRHKNVTCYITNPRPYVTFTDSVFSFQHLAMGINYNKLYRNISIKTAGRKNNFGTLLKEKKFVTRAILFDVDKAVIKPESFSFLKEFATWLSQHPEVKIEIDGHTDNDGAADHNMVLSGQRAAAIKTRLEELGVGPSRLTASGFGATKPVAPNTSSESKASNRRVEFVLK